MKMNVFAVLPWINCFLFSLFSEKLIFVPLWSKLRVTLFIISTLKKTGNIKIEKQATFKLCAGEVTFRIRYLFDLTITSKVG